MIYDPTLDARLSMIDAYAALNARSTGRPFDEARAEFREVLGVSDGKRTEASYSCPQNPVHGAGDAT